MRFLTSSIIAAAVATATSACMVTPSPLMESEVSQLAQDGYSRLADEQEPFSGAIDVYEAMARALKYNLDHRVEEMGVALRVAELDLAHFNLLPGVVATSGYAGRNNDNASNSVNVLTGVESLATSTSQERRIKTADIAFSWNILDFGLSYVRARQAADKYLIAQEMRRRAVTRIMEDVRTAFWRAISADRLIRKLNVLEARLAKAQVNARASAIDRQTSLIPAATYERELVDIKRIVRELQRDLVLARTQLAALMSIRPGTSFALAGTGRPKTPGFAIPVNQMVTTALLNRSELREVWYQRRINERELDAALLELLPGLTPYVGTNYDSNDFLYNSQWLSWGAKASWNLMRVVQYPAKRQVIEAQQQQIDARVLATTMAVVTQVHIGRIRYLQLSKELQTAIEHLNAQRRLTELMREEAGADRISEQTLIREEMNLLVAEARRDISHAGLQNAYAGIYTSMGLDPISRGLDLGADVKTLARQLRGLSVERGLALSDQRT